MQSGVEVGGDIITGTLNYMSEDPLLTYGGKGNYIALSFSGLDSEATSVTAGLDPDEEEPIELVGMDSPSGVFKVTSNSQEFVVTSTDGDERTTTQTFSLNLILVEEPEDED